MTDALGRASHPRWVPPEPDPYVRWDAAYVLGSLSGDERREYEGHLSACAQCRSAVGELSGMPALLTLLGRDEVASIDDGGLELPPLPPRLLGVLLDEVSRRRTRVRRKAWIVSASAAAAVLAAALLIAARPGPVTHRDEPPRASATSLSLTAVAPSPLEANVALISQGWGTHVEMTCTYRQDSKTAGPVDEDGDTLAMVVVGRDGTRTRLATWTALEGRTASPIGSTSMPVDAIAAVQVVSAGTGKLLLQRNL